MQLNQNVVQCKVDKKYNNESDKEQYQLNWTYLAKNDYAKEIRIEGTPNSIPRSIKV